MKPIDKINEDSMNRMKMYERRRDKRKEQMSKKILIEMGREVDKIQEAHTSYDKYVGVLCKKHNFQEHTKSRYQEGLERYEERRTIAYDTMDSIYRGVIEDRVRYVDARDDRYQDRKRCIEEDKWGVRERRRREIDDSLIKAKRRKSVVEDRKQSEIGFMDERRKWKEGGTLERKEKVERKKREFYHNVSCEYEERKRRASEVRVDIERIVHDWKKERIGEKDKMFERGRIGVEKDKREWVDRHIENQLVKERVAREAKERYESEKKRQLEESHEVHEQRVSHVVKNKFLVEKQRKEYFKSVVERLDIEIEEKRKRAEDMRVSESNIRTTRS